MDQFYKELVEIRRAFSDAFGLDPLYVENREQFIQFHHDYYISKSFETVKPRPVKYHISYATLQNPNAAKEGYFYRIIDGTDFAENQHGDSVKIPHSWALVEDAQTGKLHAVDPKYITFTDKRA